MGASKVSGVCGAKLLMPLLQEGCSQPSQLCKALAKAHGCFPGFGSQPPRPLPHPHLPQRHHVLLHLGQQLPLRARPQHAGRQAAVQEGADVPLAQAGAFLRFAQREGGRWISDCRALTKPKGSKRLRAVKGQTTTPQTSHLYAVLPSPGLPVRFALHKDGLGGVRWAARTVPARVFALRSASVRVVRQQAGFVNQPCWGGQRKRCVRHHPGAPWTATPPQLPHQRRRVARAPSSRARRARYTSRERVSR